MTYQHQDLARGAVSFDENPVKIFAECLSVKLLDGDRWGELAIIQLTGNRSDSVSFGRQKNLVRRAVRPDARINRDLRRHAIGRTSLLEAPYQKPSLTRRLARLVARLIKRS